MMGHHARSEALFYYFRLELNGDLIGIGAAVTRRPPSRPGELHPEPLTDPDVNLSIHPARATPWKPAGFRQDQEFR